MSFSEQLKNSLVELNVSFQNEMKRDYGESYPNLSKIHKKITDEFTFVLKPKDEVAYAAARNYLSNSSNLNEGEQEIISFVITRPITELGGISGEICIGRGLFRVFVPHSLARRLQVPSVW